MFEIVFDEIEVSKHSITVVLQPIFFLYSIYWVINPENTLYNLPVLFLIYF